MGWYIFGGILFLYFIFFVVSGIICAYDGDGFECFLFILFSFFILTLSIYSFIEGDVATCECCQQNHTIEVDGQCLTYPIDENGDCEKCNHDVIETDCDVTEMIINCNCCQTKVETDEKYCSQCGNELKFGTSDVSENAITYCTNCGVELQPEDKYCGSCGNAK